ncbi:hypothetical protein BC829DRAFT_415743 [Chytridium lagenaria]|nr:hypothetical protein BC829DRAFT_415743 [Chytridium lagenaria]
MAYLCRGIAYFKTGPIPRREVEEKGQKVSWGKRETVGVKKLAKPMQPGRSGEKNQLKGVRQGSVQTEEKKSLSVKYLSQLQEQIPNASKKIADAILKLRVMVTAGQLMSLSGVRRERQKITNLGKVSIPEVSFVEGQETSSDEYDSNNKMDEEKVREEIFAKVEQDGEGGRKNYARKWPKIRPLVTQSPHLTGDSYWGQNN